MSGYALTNVQNAQDDLEVKAACGWDGTDERNRAIGAAMEAGESIADIARVSGLSSDEVRAIIANLSDLPEAAYN